MTKKSILIECKLKVVYTTVNNTGKITEVIFITKNLTNGRTFLIGDSETSGLLSRIIFKVAK